MATAVDRAYGHLYERIADGRLHPGERLYEEDLADAAGVSRTPVREALRRLDERGWRDTSRSYASFSDGTFD